MLRLIQLFNKTYRTTPAVSIDHLTPLVYSCLFYHPVRDARNIAAPQQPPHQLTKNEIKDVLALQNFYKICVGRLEVKRLEDEHEHLVFYPALRQTEQPNTVRLGVSGKHSGTAIGTLTLEAKEEFKGYPPRCYLDIFTTVAFTVNDDIKPLIPCDDRRHLHPWRRP